MDSLATTTTLRKLKDALLSLPEGLNKSYDETFRRVHAQNLDQATLARKALYWVFSASRPLTVSELQHALAVETGDRTLDEDNIPDEGLLLSVCNGLLIHEGGFLSLVHYTLQEYLEQEAETLFPEAQGTYFSGLSCSHIPSVGGTKAPLLPDLSCYAEYHNWATEACFCFLKFSLELDFTFKELR